MKSFNKSIISSETLIPIYSLGELYVSDFLKPNEQPKYPPSKLELSFDPESSLVQLTCQPKNEAMWGSQYWYLSWTNPQMRIALKDVVEKTISCIPNKNNKDIFLDIASNDNTLLSFVDKNKYIRIGVDPSDYTEDKSKCEIVIKNFFSKTAFETSGYKKARYITCCAMFYDLDNPNKFLQDVYSVLEDDGIFTLQLSYTPLMLLQNEIGNIVHEHLCYYNLNSLKYVLEKNNFKIKDLELNNVNGGSIRLYIQKNIKSINNFKSPADKDISEIRINSLLEWEIKNGYTEIKNYLDFFYRINKIKEQTVSFIKKAKKDGKSIWGYGASTKANTMYQYFGLNNNFITKIAEVQERKHGLKTIGTNIPICSEEEMRHFNPDYLLIGPWFFLETFKNKEKEYLNNGGSFILTSPQFTIYNYES